MLELFKTSSSPPPLPSRGRWHFNWFSNYQPFDVPLAVPIIGTDEVLYFKTVENFFQAMKSDDPAIWRQFENVTPAKAKKMGQSPSRGGIITLRPNYSDAMAIMIMEHALRWKWQPGTSWHEKLMATGDDEIVEWNNWNDKRWGRTIWKSEGTNWLGWLLMKLRAEYRGIDVSEVDILKIAV